MPQGTKEAIKWISNGLAALGCLSAFGFTGLIAYVIGFVVNVYVPKWTGLED